VDQIQHHLNESTDEPLIVVFQHMKAQKFRGLPEITCIFEF